MRAHFALDSYASDAENPARPVANPARRTTDKELAAARPDGPWLHPDRAKQGGHTPKQRSISSPVPSGRHCGQGTAGRGPSRDGTPRPKARAHHGRDPHDHLQRRVRRCPGSPHYARAEDEARALLREMFRTRADIEVKDHKLHVILSPPSASCRTRAMVALCHELTTTKTSYSGTRLPLTHSVEDAA